MPILRFGLSYGGANVCPALAFGHAHPEGHGAFREPWFHGAIVVARKDMRQPGGMQRGSGLERGDAGIGHGGRTNVPSFDLGRHIEARGAFRDLCQAGSAALPG